MTKIGNLDEIKHIIHISSKNEPRCELCEHNHISENLYNIDFAVNHYIDKHGYKLLHIGSENLRDEEGNLLTHSAAIVGK